MQRTLTVILGGGAGSRLYPLTKYRAKPAVPLAGKYRLIDVAISNAINSGLRHVFVLTQYLSASLNRHVAQSYNFDIFSNGFVEILAAEQREEGGHWYQGTADALRQQWHTFDMPEFDSFLVLPGDALYHMDYRPLILQHRQTGADITVAVNTVHRSRAHHFGLLALDDEGQITDFREKPKGEAMNGIEAPEAMLKKFGATKLDPGDTFLASMGVYVFKRSVLERYIADPTYMDFGKQIIPEAIHKERCYGFIFPGYWEDIGTISAFFEAHMGLLATPPVFSFSVPQWPIFTRARFLPNIFATACNLDSSRIAEGSVLRGATIRNSIIGLRSIIREGAVIEDSILMGVDSHQEIEPPGALPMGIGPRCVIKRAIIDKNARIGAGVRILNVDHVMEKDHELYNIRDGIVIIPKNVTIPSGMVI